MPELPQVVITMAGHGSRFRAAGYTVPKYEIEVHGRTLFEWSMLSLQSFIDAGAAFTFVALREHRVEAFVLSMARTLGMRQTQVVEIDQVTDGQATTVLAATPVLTDHAPVLVYNIDTFVRPEAIQVSDWRDDGWIACFPGQGEGWSFARTVGPQDLQVVEVREKQRISPHASIGLYGFASLALYREAYNTYYAGNQQVEGGEKYIAPLYNQLLAWRRPVYVSVIPEKAVHPLGTPAEVQVFSMSTSIGSTGP